MTRKVFEVGDRVVTRDLEGTISEVVNSHKVMVNWIDSLIIGNTYLESKLLKWDEEMKVWDVKQGRNYV
jgi:hypothetical protein